MFVKVIAEELIKTVEPNMALKKTLRDIISGGGMALLNYVINTTRKEIVIPYYSYRTMRDNFYENYRLKVLANKKMKKPYSGRILIKKEERSLYPRIQIELSGSPWHERMNSRLAKRILEKVFQELKISKYGYEITITSKNEFLSYLLGRLRFRKR